VHHVLAPRKSFLLACIAVAVLATSCTPIEVVAGTYGANCGQPRGNKTSFLAEECDGETSCAYTVDYKVIGDPANGCAKDYIAEWQCGSDPTVRQATASPEAGHGKTVVLSCAASPTSPTSASYPLSQGVQVVAGTYGANCGQERGNKTSFLAASCNGDSDCAYTIDYKVIGDPVDGCAKDYIAEWRCGTDPTIRRASASPEAGYRKTVHLACPP
jgi:hypothetical protein